MGQLHRARIIGYLPNGVPVREIRGGSGQTFEPGGQGQGGQGGGDPAGGQGGQGDPDLIGGSGTTEPPAGGGQGDPAGAVEQPPAWWAAASAAQTAALNSEIDRRINALRNPRNGGGQGNGQQGGQQEQGQQQQGRGVDQRDLRDAQGEFRDIMRDASLTAGERDFVNAIRGGVVQAELGRSGDPYEAGANAARTVQTHIENLRRSHQAEMMTRLRQMGAIDEEKLRGRPGTAQQAGGAGRSFTPGTQSAGEQFSGGVASAQDLAKRRGLATPGSNTPA